MPTDPVRPEIAETDLPVEDLTVLLTEASAACHGNLNVLALRAAIKDMPDAVLDHAGLQWARRSLCLTPSETRHCGWFIGWGP